MSSNAKLRSLDLIQRTVESDGKVLNRSDTWKELRVQDCTGKRSPTYLHKFSLLAVVFRTATLSKPYSYLPLVFISKPFIPNM